MARDTLFAPGGSARLPSLLEEADALHPPPPAAAAAVAAAAAGQGPKLSLSGWAHAPQGDPPSPLMTGARASAPRAPGPLAGGGAAAPPPPLSPHAAGRDGLKED